MTHQDDFDDPATDQPVQPTLFLVATPIGNLKDITYRAVETLTAAPVIACEDTRRARTLLTALKIPVPRRFIVHAEHTEDRASEQILSELRDGHHVALITDAGTPVVSDPGFRAVKAALEAGFNVTVIPGPSAPMTAFAASAVGGCRYCFLGFLPKKSAAVRTMLLKYKNYPDALIFFEPARRMEQTLIAVRDCLGERFVCVGREMTKRFEEYIRGTASSVIEQIQGRTLKGECTVVVGGRARNKPMADGEDGVDV
ncbi:MAG: 16S rRNA (cytidine(1402)-2'-O)-methyltransferase [Planctomycetota bacterium]